jgi:hypothetical protein
MFVINNIILFSGDASPGTKGAASSLSVIKSLRLKNLLIWKLNSVLTTNFVN